MIEAQKFINTKVFLAMGDMPNLTRALKEWDYWDELNRS